MESAIPDQHRITGRRTNHDVKLIASSVMSKRKVQSWASGGGQGERSDYSVGELGETTKQRCGCDLVHLNINLLDPLKRRLRRNDWGIKSEITKDEAPHWIPMGALMEVQKLWRPPRAGLQSQHLGHSEQIYSVRWILESPTPALSEGSLESSGENPAGKNPSRDALHERGVEWLQRDDDIGVE